MEFREFFTLNEDRHYVLMKMPTGEYKVVGPKSRQNISQAMAGVARNLNPAQVWSYSIANGRLNLPPELEPEKEAILHAHFDRFHTEPGVPEPQFDFGSTIDPKTMLAQYPQQHALWKKYQSRLPQSIQPPPEQQQPKQPILGATRAIQPKS